MNLDNALMSHVQWKSRFRNALDKGDTLYVEVVESDDCCELGRWLREDGLASFGQRPGYGRCVELHAAFHAEAGRVAQAVNDRHRLAVDEMLAQGSTYSQASSALAEALVAFKQEINRR